MIVSEFGGGLGDVVTLIYNSERYNVLEHLGPDERAMIVLMCHNPFAKELFLWHPQAGRFDIRDVGFWWPHEDQEKRAAHGLPPAQPLQLIRQERARFYPSPNDRKILDNLEPFSYIVVSAAAGGLDRNLPTAIVRDGIDAIIQGNHGFRAVTVGRTYSLHNRIEHRFAPTEGLVNCIDQLTVPGTFELIARSAGVFACHSAISLMAWYLEKPLFLAYPPEVRARDFERPPHQYTFGKDRPTTIHLEFRDYTRQRFLSFLGIADSLARIHVRE